MEVKIHFAVFLCGIGSFFIWSSSHEKQISERLSSVLMYLHGSDCCSTFFRIDQIFVDKRKSVFILIFQKCNPHLFLEYYITDESRMVE